MEEIWKDIQGYEGLYQVSNLGRIRSLDKYRNNRFYPSQILKSAICKGNGYSIVSLCKNGKQTSYTVHRLVAEAFIPNPENLPFVNHKDETRTNNSVENLEWCTVLYNNTYGTAKQRQSKTLKGHKNINCQKPIIQIIDNDYVKWDSLADASRELHISRTSISNCLTNRAKTAGGYRWIYA